MIHCNLVIDMSKPAGVSPSQEGGIREMSMRRWFWRGLKAFGVLVAVALVLFLAWRVWIERQARTALQDLRAQGHPVRFDEFVELYHRDFPSNPDNAVEIYFKAMDAVSRERAGRPFCDVDEVPIVSGARFPPPGEPFPSEQAEAIEAYLAAYPESLTLLHEALGRPEGRWPPERHVSPDIPLDDFAALRQLMRLLVLEAGWHAHEGRAEESAAAVKAQWRLVRSARRMPVITEQLVALAIQDMAVHSLMRTLARVSLPEESREFIDELLTVVLETDSALMAVSGELVLVLDPNLVREAIALPHHGVLERTVSRLYTMLGGHAWDITLIVPDAKLLLNAYAQPRHERLQAYAVYLGESRAPRERGGILARYGLLALSPVVEVPATTKTMAARIALALDNYRTTWGRLPETLDELVPNYIAALPEDPFLGQAFEYVSEEPAYALYPSGLDALLKEARLAGYEEGLLGHYLLQPSPLTFAVHWKPGEVHD